MTTRRDLLAAAAGSAGLMGLGTAVAQAPTPTGAPAAPQPPAPQPPAAQPAVDVAPIPGQSRGSAPGPWQMPEEHPDLGKLAQLHAAPYSDPIKHAEFKLAASADPIALFIELFKAAKAAGDADAEAMTLATVDSAGMPDARMMLLHWINDGRFQFSSYENSAKGKQLKANPKAALLFYWKKTGQMVRVRGSVQPFTRAQNEQLRLVKRPSLDLQLHDWVFHQSEVYPHDTPDELEDELRQAKQKFPDSVPLRDWTGYFLLPLAIEFFRPVGAAFNAERLRFTRRKAGAEWRTERLVP
jgi:pyridoxamine 5'-phosphate oxidase